MKRSGYVESQKGYGIHLQKLLRRRYVKLQHQKMERNMATNGDEEVEKTSEETVVDLVKTIPDEQLLKLGLKQLEAQKKEEYMVLVLEIVLWQIHWTLMVHPLVLLILQMFLLNKFLKHPNFSNFLIVQWSNGWRTCWHECKKIFGRICKKK